MNWRHKVTLSFIPLIVLLAMVLKEEKKEETFKRPQTRRVASASSPRLKIQEPQRVRALANKSLRHTILRNRIPQSLEATFSKDTSVKITRGFELLKDIVAISKESFQSTMGEVIKQDETFVYFRTEKTEKFIPVALSSSTNMLYPISSIIHVKEVGPASRDAILGKGYSEYYYHPSLKFLSLEALNGQILRSYNDLVRQGYKVELEVLKPGHKSI